MMLCSTFDLSVDRGRKEKKKDRDRSRSRSKERRKKRKDKHKDKEEARASIKRDYDEEEKGRLSSLPLYSFCNLFCSLSRMMQSEGTLWGLNQWPQPIAAK